MNEFVRKLKRLQLSDLPRAVRKAYLIPLLLRAPHDQSNAQALADLFPDVSGSRIDELLDQFSKDDRYSEEMDRNMRDKRGRGARLGPLKAFYYSVVRLLEPDVVVETGVFDGETTAAILLGLDHNGRGRLISIDLPARQPISDATARNGVGETQLPAGCDPGWVVPDFLRGRHDLRLGDARELLPQVLDEHPRIDLFLHDSLHTYAHMTFEYELAWEAVRRGGLLASHDIYTNHAFRDFCRRKTQTYVRREQYGLIRKPSARAAAAPW